MRGFAWRVLQISTVLLAAAAASAQGVISTVAGSSRAFRGDGRPAIQASLGSVLGVAVDTGGNVYVSDHGNQLVMKVSPTGTLTVVAGNGILGFSGDGGPATSASLNDPEDVAWDSSGNLYIADFLNHRVRKVTPEGIITTVVGTGVAGFAGDGGPATSALLNGPVGIAFDAAGNLYIADFFNHRIRRVGPSGTISTVAGDGVGRFSGDGGPATQASLYWPTDVALDAAGNLYIADRINNRIRKVTPGGTITTVAGGGTLFGDNVPATAAALAEPHDVAVDGAGNLYIADRYTERVRMVNSAGRIVTVAGTGVAGFSGDGGPATSARLFEPVAVAVDRAGNVYVGEYLNFRVRKISSSGTITTLAGNGLFGFSGDGGPATSAGLLVPRGVTADGLGNFFIADTFNHRIRKVSSAGTISTVAGDGSYAFSFDGLATSASVPEPQGVGADGAGNLYIAEDQTSRVRKVSPTGIITTVAGTGVFGFSGDNGPATQAALSGPRGVAVDASGNIYIADNGNHRIRKVSTAGIITTIAGSGLEGFSGDGGPATSASLRFPNYVAVDRAGNVYVSDTGNNRIRKVSAAGTITTIAGNGVEGFSGDGGPGASAALNQPRGIAADSAGNVYIADYLNHRIRRVTPGGTISTFAGNGASSFVGDGGLSTGASLNAPHDVAVDGAGNIYIADSINDRIRKVLVAVPSLSVSPTTLSFSAPAGSTSAAQPVTVSSPLTGLVWSGLASTESGGNWLLVSPAGGTAPGVVSISVNAATLTSGTYRGRVTVEAPGAGAPAQTVTVQLTVQAALAAKLAVDPRSLSFEMESGRGNPPPATLHISNAGGGTLAWTARAETANGGNWLSVSSSSGAASPGAPSAILVQANVAGLEPGVYSGSLRVASETSGEELIAPVTLLLTRLTQTILVSQSGLLFTGVERGAAAPSQEIGIVNIGQGIMNWTIETSTLAGGNWLSVSPASGRSDAASLQIPLVEVLVSTAGMQAGRYSGQIRVIASGADNSPQVVTVELNVLPPGSNPGVVVRPTGLIFAARAGASSPGSQGVRLGAAAPGSVEARVFPATFDRGTWLQSKPSNLEVSSAEAGSLTVQTTLGSLAPGVYRGGVTLLFADGSPAQTVNVLFLVVGATGVSGQGRRSTDGRDAAAGEEALACTPQRLYAALRSHGNNFNSPQGWPSPMEAQVLDDCGNPVTNATVVVSFTNGDPPLPLANLRTGIYSGTWRPLNPSSEVTVTLRASAAGLAAVEVRAQGQVGGGQTAPVVPAGGVVSGASFAAGAPLAPGSIVSIFGSNMAQGLNYAQRVPLETVLGGASLTVGGRDVPLFFSSTGQINAQLPFELTPNSRPQVVLKTRRQGAASDVYAAPETITIAAARPAIFTTNQQGSGQGAILDRDGVLVDSAHAVAVGDVVQVFCTGLGLTNPAVRSGEPAPGAEPLARVVSTVEARVGGQSAPVQFAGLAPGFVGLYQVNVQIPAGVTPGSAVTLVLTQNGVPSNTVTLAIR